MKKSLMILVLTFPILIASCKKSDAEIKDIGNPGSPPPEYEDTDPYPCTLTSVPRFLAYSGSDASTFEICKQLRGSPLYYLLKDSLNTSGVLHGFELRFTDADGSTQSCTIDTTGAPAIVFDDLSLDFRKAYDEGRFHADEVFTDFNAFLDSTLPLVCN